MKASEGSDDDLSAVEDLLIKECRKRRKRYMDNDLDITEIPQFKDKIDVIVLRNILTYAERYKYDLTEKDFTFFRYSKADRHWDGQYALWNGRLYALSSSKHGPVFIMEHERYFLKDHKFTFYHENISSSKCFFQAVIDDNIVADVRYPDPGWCDVFDDIDLGHWIAEQSKNDDFIERYTIA
ncbi:MAG: hypothetical protein K2N72_06965 [Oscillospiraceae bacterium]|nr:hypothetical protein [Oscillospiraceae bacterium]